MNKVYANSSSTLGLGRQGENFATQVIFDLSGWVAGYGDGTPELIHQRVVDEKPYPVPVERVGDTLIWTVSNLDTEVVSANGRNGRCELRYYVGETLVKSRTWLTCVSKAMGTPSETRPPESDKGWVDRVLEASAVAQEAAKRSEDALTKAPKIGDKGNWYIWDSTKGEYVDTGCYSGGSAPYIGANGNWYVGQEDSGIPATGPSGSDGADGAAGPAGAGGKSAYQYAVDGGYTGTEAEFAAKLAAEIPAVDDTLTASGKAADAAAVGARLSSLSEEMLTQESDPTVPSWAKAAQKPSYTASEVGADPSGTATSQVSAHNTGTDTHSDIRLLIQGLTDRLNALADSDDTTLDQLSEIVAYIKSNRDLISAITTSKVNVSDIIDNLTTNASNKPLSAAQGVALKALIDAITVPDKLPNPNALTFTGAVTGSYDGSAAVTVNIPSGGGSGSDISLGLTGAAAGQIAKITAVDDTGKPTVWSPVDMPSGGGGSAETFELIKYIKTTEAVSEIRINADDIGEPFELKEVQIYTLLYFQDDAAAPILIRLHSSINGSGTNYDWPFIAKSPSIKSNTAVGYPAAYAGHFKPKDYTIDNKKYWVADTWNSPSIGTPSTAGAVNRIDFLFNGVYETHVMDAVRCVMINLNNGAVQIGANSKIWIFGKRGKVT